MDNIFKRTSAHWVRYDKYEWKESTDGVLYLTPAKDAVMSLYNPIKEYEELVLTALGIGLDVMQKKASMEELKQRIQDFAQRFGLLGLMTALPTTPEFITYDAVYLPKNHFIKQETLSTEDYLAYFFPFDKISFVKKGRESMWNTDNWEMLAVIMTLQDKPQAVLMSFQKEYAESYEWITTVFSDWAFTFVTSFLYYQDYDALEEAERNVYRKGMECFGGIAPTYHLELLDKPTIVWDFHSFYLPFR